MIEAHKTPEARPLRDQVVQAIRSTDEVATAIIETLSRSLASAFHGAAEVVEDVLDGAVQIGSDLGQAAQGLVVGLLRATRQTGEAALVTIRDVARAAVQKAGRFGGDVGRAAQGAVQGAIRGARDAGVDARQAASEAAQSALDAAEEVGAAAGRKVRDALQGAVDGIKVILKQPVKPRPPR